MKILQVSAFFPPHTGGSEAYCQQLSSRLAKRGHEVTVVTSRHDRSSAVRERLDGYEVWREPSLGVVWGINPATFILKKLLRSKFDIVHAHSYIFFTSNQAAFLSRILKIPLLLHLHGGLDAQWSSGDFLTRFKLHIKRQVYDRTLGKWTARAANAVGSVSKRDLDIARRIWDLDETKVHWVPNAVDPSLFNGNHNPNGLKVAFIGRLEPWKGINTLLRVAKIVREERGDAEFLIVGDGSLRGQVKSCPWLRDATLLGQIPHSSVPSVLANTSVLVIPSLTEGMPTVCLEAMASGVPVVASKVGGTSEVVIDGETGYLFDPGNAISCAERIITLLSDPSLRHQMGEQGKKLVSREYAWDGVLEKIEAVYRRIEATCG